MSTRLHNRYQILEPIGEGGEYVVYLGLDTTLDRKVVIKRKKDSLQSINALDWQREAKLLEQIHIDTVVTCLDAFISRIELVPYGYLVQEYVEGTTLDIELSKKRYTQLEVKEIILEILAIIIKLQQLSPPIMHRDIKPSNIIRRKSDQRLMLLDFGLAIDQTLDHLGHTIGVGSLGYQAPEQISGFPTLSSDIYSIGAMAVELLGRKAPKTMLRNQKLIWKESVATVHENWKKWLHKALAPEKERFQNAEEAWSALSQLELPVPQNERTAPLMPEAEIERASQEKSQNKAYKEKTKPEEPFVEVLPESSQAIISQQERKRFLQKNIQRYRLWSIIILLFSGGTLFFLSLIGIIYFSTLLTRIKNDQLEEADQIVDRINGFCCSPIAILIMPAVAIIAGFFSSCF